VADEQLSEFVEPRSVTAAFDDSDAQLPLQQGDARGYCRLGYALSRRRARERALLGDREQEAKMTRVDFHNLSL